MRAIKVNLNTGNPELKNGKFQFVYDIYVVEQNCNHAMRQQLGELNFAVDKGIEYFDNVYNGTPNLQRFEAQARTQILNVDGVDSITSFEYELVTGDFKNVLEYSITIKTVYGTITAADSYAEQIARKANNDTLTALLASQKWVNAGIIYSKTFGVYN